MAGRSSFSETAMIGKKLANPRWKNRNWSEEEKISHALSKVLRHSAHKLGIPIHEDGYVKFKDLQVLKQFDGLTEENLRKIVSEDRKNRYSIQTISDEIFIRANQGHSIPSLKEKINYHIIKDPSELPECVIHGTSYENWEKIKETGGLKRMKRLHIHMAEGIPGVDNGVISGMRENSEVRIYIDVRKAMHEGIVFLRSTNNVILSTGLGNEGLIPLSCFNRIQSRSGKVIL